MCPYFNPSKSECKVVPYDSSAKRDDSWVKTYCQGNYRSCGNYEAAQRGEYTVRR